ncbi:MAG: methyltransferase domain-containing protein [Bacillus sp. (in: Bacteria)]|nr:methyltransferase domain-containing protein [Bacillus sp. (in: firmicutes)]
MRQINFGQVVNSYAHTREDIPVNLMDSLHLRNIFFEGKNIADIGSGTGVLTRKMARRKADVVGVEPSIDLLGQAKEMNKTKNFTIPYRQGSAEATGLKDLHYDIVTFMRSWHLFDHSLAIQEMKRILKAKGTLIVMDSGYLSGSTIGAKTFEVLAKYVEGDLKPAELKAEPKLRINGFLAQWFEEWQQNGFELRDFYKLNYTINFSKKEWIERVESITWLTRLDEPVRKQALAELFASLPDQGPYVIPYECNVCILRLEE